MSRIDAPHPPARLVGFREALYGCLEGWAAASWTAPLDADTTTTIAQIRDPVGRLGCDGPVPLFVFDAGYDLSRSASPGRRPRRRARAHPQ